MFTSRVVASVLLLITGSRAQSTHTAHVGMTDSTASADTVWFWFATCEGPTMILVVRLDKVPVYETAFPICRADRESPSRQGEAGRFSVWFAPRRAIVWEGYRDDPDTTRAAQVIEGDVWQAGADSGDLVLGVSFMTPDRIVMNTLHIMRPGASDSTQIARGLVVLTYPMKPRR